jgi:hypothetical protein
MSLWKIIMLVLLAGNVVFGILQLTTKKEKVTYHDKNFGWLWGIMGWLCVIFGLFSV